MALYVFPESVRQFGFMRLLYALSRHARRVALFDALAAGDFRVVRGGFEEAVLGRSPWHGISALPTPEASRAYWAAYPCAAT